MTLIRVRGEATEDTMIPQDMLLQLVLKSIFDDAHMTKRERHLMEDAFCAWYEYLEGKIIETAVGEEQKIQLERMAKMIQANEEGKYEHRKQMLKEHNIDYLKFYRIKSPTKKELLQAAAYQDEWNRKNGFNDGKLN